MVIVVTLVGFLIHLYSVPFMSRDSGYARFFAGMNLFVASMLTLVLAGDYFLLYLGWEGVGFCSYLLIGFWYNDPFNVLAGNKAFIMTRIGDTSLALGLFMIYSHLGTLNIQAAAAQASVAWYVGEMPAVIAALLILGGAVGKSAQLPLQTWLPDAMAGPSPVSALLHAATMVTAGVYLIARSHVFFELAPAVMVLTAVIGVATMLIASISALVQRDIKRILAYSTMSQIGYMFIALGVGAFGAAVFHLGTHAFFKALLFLCAGVVIQALGEEHDIFKMGGLRARLPLVFWAFLIGAASLSAIPLISAGFYSKDLILLNSWASERGSQWLWLGGVLGSFLTALYSFRMVFTVFFGKENLHPSCRRPSMLIIIPLALFSFFSVASGFIETPDFLGGISVLSNFLHSSLPPPSLIPISGTAEICLYADTILAPLLGVLVAWIFYFRYPYLVTSWATTRAGSFFQAYFLNGWGFDRIYSAAFADRLIWLARINRKDVMESLYDVVAWTARVAYRALSVSQAGRLRLYAAWIALGAFILIALVIAS